MVTRSLVLVAVGLAGACAPPPAPVAADPPWLTRDVGSPSEVTTQPSAGEGYRVVACAAKGSVLGVVGLGSKPVPDEYPVRYEAMRRLESALGPAALGVTYGRSCEQERSALRVLVRSYRDADEAVRRTVAFVRDNDLDVSCSVDLAPDSTLKSDDWRIKPMSRDVGTMADVKTQPGVYDGYVVRPCTQYGLLGIEGTGRGLRPRDQPSLARLHGEVEAFLKPTSVGVGFGLGCRSGDVGFRIYVMHLRDVDAAIVRAGEFLRTKDMAVTMTVHIVSEGKLL